jgi:hypothetical protein
LVGRKDVALLGGKGRIVDVVTVVEIGGEDSAGECVGRDGLQKDGSGMVMIEG